MSKVCNACLQSIQPRCLSLQMVGPQGGSFMLFFWAVSGRTPSVKAQPLDARPRATIPGLAPGGVLFHFQGEVLQLRLYNPLGSCESVLVCSSLLKWRFSGHSNVKIPVPLFSSIETSSTFHCIF